VFEVLQTSVLFLEEGKESKIKNTSKELSTAAIFHAEV
jgi:hypothetical protein